MVKPTEALASPCPLVLLLLFGSFLSASVSGQDSGFDKNYVQTWGGDHLKKSNGGSEVTLYMDRASGAGFSSEHTYGSGFFHLSIKLPQNSAGVVTAFYLSSKSSKHDEIDIEFLGNVANKPIIMQTNIFAGGVGNREQRVTLWFDPTSDFHDYKILWNPYQIVIYVDDVPVRVYANKGGSYPSQPMQIVASIWNGDDWATDGGKTKVNWSFAPFRASFKAFNVDGCSTTTTKDPGCSSSSVWWNSLKKLSSSEEKKYQNVVNKYMTYDYCKDTRRFPTIPQECNQ